ncbi:MAG TPA: histidine kinase [Desulfobacter sp.]|nr:histidine kinase [Desulfobacter sp.]
MAKALDMEHTILLVDDEPDFRETLAKRLGNAGYHVYTAATGTEAMSIFRDVSPMIVLMDVVLPDADGLMLLQQMKEEIPDTEIIMITGHGNMELAVKSFQNDATDFITKPFDRDTLNLALDRALKKTSIRRRLHKYAENKAMRDMVIKELINEDVMVIASDYRILDINEPMLEKLGITRDEAIGHFCYEITHHQDHPCSGDDHPCPLSECFKTQKPSQTTHVHLNHKNQEIYYSISCYPIFENGRVSGAIELSRDITPEINNQKNLLQQSKLASVGRLAAGVAHEINNPLTTILTTSMLIREEMKPDDPYYEDMGLITRETLRCRRIVSAFLDFARQSQPVKKKHNLSHVIDEIVLLTRKQAAFKDIGVESVCSDKIPRIVMDKGQIEQALINLMLNAIEATAPGGRITVCARLSADQTHAEITIQDTGCGISKEAQDKIFDPFFTTKENGTGLGLAITSGIISQHGGSISVESLPNQGTRFAIHLPLSQDGNHAE